MTLQLGVELSLEQAEHAFADLDTDSTDKIGFEKFFVFYEHHSANVKADEIEEDKSGATAAAYQLFTGFGDAAVFSAKLAADGTRRAAEAALVGVTESEKPGRKAATKMHLRKLKSIVSSGGDEGKTSDYTSGYLQTFDWSPRSSEDGPEDGGSMPLRALACQDLLMVAPRTVFPSADRVHEISIEAAQAFESEGWAEPEANKKKKKKGKKDKKKSNKKGKGKAAMEFSNPMESDASASFEKEGEVGGNSNVPISYL